MSAGAGELLVKFGLVGVLGFAVDAGFLSLGLTCGLPSWAARALSLTVALHLTFFLNGTYVFRALRRDRLGRQWATYLLSNGAGALCNYLIFVALISARKPFFSEPAVAFGVAAVAALGVNFTGSRLVAFRA